MRVFVLKHKRVEEAALLIRPHLSESASITLTQRLNAMTITDRPEKLDQIGKVLAAFDVAPRGFTFAVKLVRARADVPAGSIAREIGGLGAKLKSLFQFNDYALIDSAVLRGVEGGRVEYEFGGEYLLSFTIRPAGDGQDLLLAPFALSRERKGEGLPLLDAALSGLDPGHALADPGRRRLQGGGVQERPDPDPPGPGDAARRRPREGNARS